MKTWAQRNLNAAIGNVTLKHCARRPLDWASHLSRLIRFRPQRESLHWKTYVSHRLECPTLREVSQKGILHRAPAQRYSSRSFHIRPSWAANECADKSGLWSATLAETKVQVPLPLSVEGRTLLRLGACGQVIPLIP